MSRFVYQGVLQDGNGKRLADGNVAVLLAGTSTPASIYAASTGGVAVAAVTTDDDGSWAFYIDEADYAGTQRFDVVMSKSGYLSITTEDIEVLPASAHVGLTVKDATTNSKQLTVDISGATAAKTVTLTSAHTDDRVITLPDATDTLVGKATTDTLTNKTLTSPTLNASISGTAFLDEDDMASDSATSVASQQSIKAYCGEESSTSITPGGDFTSGTLYLAKVGKLVIISWENLAHLSGSAPSSAVGDVPAAYRPGVALANNVYATGSSKIFYVSVDSSGTLAFVYRDYAGALANNTGTASGSLSYLTA